MSTEPDREYVTVELTYSEVNSESGGTKLHVFHCPRTGGLREGGPDTFLSTAVADCKTLGSRITVSRFPARKNIREDIGGKLFVSSYRLAEGEVFMLSCLENMRAMARGAAIYFRLRSTGPLLKVIYSVPSWITDAAVPSWNLTGRFDICTPDTVSALGVRVLTGTRDEVLPAAADSLFTVETLAAEIAAVPVVVTQRVGKLKMPVLQRTRKLDLQKTEDEV